MNFELTESENMVRDTARKFLAQHTSIDANVQAYDSVTGYSDAVWTDVAGVGWLALVHAADGDEITTLGILAEEIGRVSFASPFLSCISAGLVLARTGSDSVEPRLDSVAAGEQILALVDPATAQTPLVAKRSADGAILQGGPALVEWGNRADAFVIPIQLDGKSFVACIDRATKGLGIKGVKRIDNARSAAVSFDGVTISSANLLMIDPNVLEEALGLCRLLAAVEAIGGAYGALDVTVAHVKERVQFGRQIGSFQAVKHGLADSRALMDGAWLATWDGLAKAAKGQALEGSPALASWLVKRAFQDMAYKGSQYQGGMGHVVESHMQFYYRRAANLHGRFGSEWDMLGKIAASYVVPKFNLLTT